MSAIGGPRPSKRARQACDPCRRKKSRCPGEKPVCSYCERLGQQCVYSHGEFGDVDPAVTADMAKRLSSLEGKLEELVSSLGSQQRVQQELTPCPSNRLQDANFESSFAQATDMTPEPQSAINATAAQLFNTYCNYQPLPLFNEDGFVETISSRDPELLLAIQAISLRFRPQSGADDETTMYIRDCARKSRILVMDRVGQSKLELSTLQTLCLLAMFDFSEGDTVQAGLNINMAMYLTRSINLGDEVLGNLQTDPDEKRRCFWCIYFLQNLQGDGIQTPRLLAGVRTPFDTGSGLNPTYGSLPVPEQARGPSNSTKEDFGIVSYNVQLSELWSLAMTYAASRVEPNAPPPWSPHSDYSIVTFRHIEFDSRVPLKYRYHANRFQNYTIHELNQRRHFWCTWLFIQFLYLTIPCLLNHPFLLSMRLRSFRHTMPQSFIRQSFENITICAGWILHLIDLVEHKGFEVCDPIVGHCIVIVATIHLQHSFVEDPVLRDKAQEGFAKCLRFLRPLGERWPHVGNMIKKLYRFQEGVSVNSTGTTGTTRPSQTQAQNASLLWELLVYDSASRSSHPRQDSLFGTTIFDHGDNRASSARLTPDPGFPLVGSAGISGHKTVAKEVSVYPPDSVTTPPPAPDPPMQGVNRASASTAEPFNYIGDSIVDGIVTDQLFPAPEDYGRTIEDWWEFSIC